MSTHVYIFLKEENLYDEEFERDCIFWTVSNKMQQDEPQYSYSIYSELMVKTFLSSFLSLEKPLMTYIIKKHQWLALKCFFLIIFFKL